MNESDLTQLTVDILTSYYNNELQPFFDYCHKDILWLGPAKDQIIRTKQTLMEAYGKETNPLRFAVNDLTATPVYIAANCMNILLTFVVDTFWPDGGSNRVFQRITFTWERKRNEPPRIRMCHVSNAIDYDTRDSIYPVHYLESHPQMTLYTESSKRLHFTGPNRTTLYTSPEQILYMESAGNHTRIHMFSQVFECNARLSAVCNQITEGFIRCHASYLVNPLYVQSITRFSLTMSDGRKIPVPEKKYTRVKAALLQAQQKPQA